MSTAIDFEALLQGISMFGHAPGEDEGQDAEIEAARKGLEEVFQVQRGCRDMLREAAKQFRLAGDHGHATMCDRQADAADAALTKLGGQAAYDATPAEAQRRVGA